MTISVFENSAVAPILESMLLVIASSVGLVTVLTSATKRFVKQFPANTIAGFYIVLIWGIFAVASYIGIDADLQQYIDKLTEVGFALLGLTGTAVASGLWYQVNKTARVPIIGAKQNEDPAPEWEG